MTATADPDAQPPRKKGSKLPIILGLVLAVAGAGGGFAVSRLGLVPFAGSAGAAGPDPVIAEEMPAAAYVALDPMVINLPPGSDRQFLRFSAQLEVVPDYRGEVAAMRPRVVDVLNGYLRAVEASDLEAPSALTRLRAQMLRRIQVVVGDGRVRDLLIMEFVLN